MRIRPARIVSAIAGVCTAYLAWKLAFHKSTFITIALGVPLLTAFGIVWLSLTGWESKIKYNNGRPQEAQPATEE